MADTADAADAAVVADFAGVDASAVVDSAVVATGNLLDLELRWPSGKYICHYRVPASTLVESIVEQLEAGNIPGVVAVADDVEVQRYELAHMGFIADDEDEEWSESFMTHDKPLDTWFNPGGGIITLVPVMEPRRLQVRHRLP